ncbi:MAG: class I SAM-dependent methyltransferase, partial [Oscillospiraceae bacterium]|nr:class I SAM-dependent methyltransferase [Oscillospiraceae bacterium]
MTPPTLDGRLAAAAAFVRPGARMADIGCDHGKLSVHMAMTEKARYVIAVDARPQPLRKARALAVRAKMEKRVECRLGDGLTALRPEEADDIVMAGISGVTAAEILAASPSFWQEDKRFIFVPASKAADLRRWLCGHGFKIEA